MELTLHFHFSSRLLHESSLTRLTKLGGKFPEDFKVQCKIKVTKMIFYFYFLYIGNIKQQYRNEKES